MSEIKQPPRIRLRRSASGTPWGEAPKALRGGHNNPMENQGTKATISKPMSKAPR